MLKPVLGSQLNLGSHLARGLVGFWLFNEGSGNKVFDLSGNGNTGTFVNDASWVSGKFGSAVQLDGDGDQVTFTPASGFDFNAFTATTICMWVKADSLAAANGRHTFWDARQTTNSGFTFHTENTLVARGIRFWAEASDTGFNSNANVFSETGRWYHVVIVYNIVTGAVIFYVDGIFAGSGSVGANENLSAPIYRLGIDNDGSRDWNGSFDNLLIYNRGLSASEIALLYRAMFQI